MLYDACFDELWRTVRGRVDRQDRAEDVVQETWLVAVRRIEHFDPELGPFIAWLHGIAARVLANERRRDVHREGRRVALDPESPADPESPLGDERSELVLAQLPGRYRELLVAKYVEELSVAEIALRHSESKAAIESALGRARAAFRRHYPAWNRDE